MKLDSIIYDINTLNTALTSALTTESPTFNAMYPSETATSLVNTLSGVGSMLQYTLVSAMANAYTDSAFSPSGIYQLAETLGNNLHGNTASRIVCDIVRTTTRGTSLIIPKESVFEVEGLKFFNKSAISFSSNTTRVNDVTLIQGKVVEVELQTTGVANEKLYFSEKFKADPENIQVFVNGEEWNVSDTFIAYDISSVVDESELKTVVYRTTSDGQSYIKVGNGISGLLPAANSIIKVRYVDNEGAKGNITKSNLDIQLKTNIFNTNNVLLKVTFPKTTTAYGGSNSQSLDVLKESSPYVFASGNRCIRRSDYYAMLLNKCGYITANVWGEYEEAQFYGTYDKIMMNMVYYTGIKNFTMHDYENIGKLEDMYHFEGTIGSSKAFPGSVSVKMTYDGDITNEIRYEDNGGKGLLFNNNDYQFNLDNFNQSYKAGTATINLVNEADVNNGRDISNIIYDESTLNLYYESAKIPTFVDPVQIRLDFDEPTSIAGLKFFIPYGDVTFVRNAMNSFAIFGTNEEIMTEVDKVKTLNTSLYSNVRNKTNVWTRVVNRSNFVAPNVGNWSNWIATNLYNPNELDAENIWKTFKHYVIEIYNVQDESQSTVKVGKMKVLYNNVIKGTETVQQVSTVNYDDNGALSIYIPSINALQGFYVYDYTVNNLTAANYNIGDVLTYSHDVGEYLYTAHDLDSQNPSTGYSVGDVVKLLDPVTGEDTGLRYEIDTNEITTGKALSGHLLENSLQGDVKYDDISISSTGVTNPQVDKLTFTNKVHPTTDVIVEFIYVEADSIWKLDNLDVNLADYGITFSGTPHDENTITVHYTLLNTVFNTELDQKSTVELTIISDVEGTIAVDSSSVYDNPQGLQVTLDTTPIVITFRVTAEKKKSEDTDDFTYRVDVIDEYFHMNKVDINVLDQALISRDGTAKGATINISSSYGVDVEAAFTGNKIEDNEVAKIDQTIIADYNHFTTYLEFKQPEVIQTHINVRVKYNAYSSAEVIRQAIRENVDKLFEIDASYMGRTLKLSDIYNAIHDTEGVDYCLIDTPTANIIALPYQFIVLSSLTIEDII